jgi:hypothetical protein
MEREDAGGVETIFAHWHRSESVQSDGSAYSIFPSQDVIIRDEVFYLRV